LKNIDRTDEDWKLQLENYIKIREKHGGKIRLEMILGLPGATLDSYYEALDYSCTMDTFGKRYVWHLLPTTPASKAEYREKFKIQTLKTSFGMRSTNDGTFTILKKHFVENLNVARDLVVDPEWMCPTEIVIETMSYSKEEWLTMFLMDYVVHQAEVGELLSSITKYMASTGIPHSVFYRKLWDSFLFAEGNGLTPTQNILLQSMWQQGLEKIQKDEAVDFEYFDVPENFPFQVRCLAGPLFNIMLYSNIKAFYIALARWCNMQFGEDPIRDDLIVYTSSMIKNINYTPNQYTFSTEYDWSKYRTNGVFVKRPTTYQPNDLVLWGEMTDINTRIKQHFLSICSNMNGTKLFEKIKVSYPKK